MELLYELHEEPLKKLVLEFLKEFPEEFLTKSGDYRKNISNVLKRNFSESISVGSEQISSGIQEKPLTDFPKEKKNL